MMPLSSKLGLLGAVWALALAGWIIMLAAEGYLAGTTSCELGPGTSVFGTAEWSWLPPGRTCTWELPGGPHADEPPVARLGVLLLFALWGGSLMLLRSGNRDPVTAESAVK